MPSSENKILKPKDYQNVINKLDIGSFELKTSSIFEARITMVNLEQLEEALLEIKHCISGDMRAITLKYLDSNHNHSSFLGLKRTKISSRRKSLNIKRENKLEHYRKIVNIIDNYLQQIEEAKEYLNNIKA